jgi:steroid C-25 hydroxylase gamma subunit
MDAKRIAASRETLLDPDAKLWSGLGATEVSLEGTPLSLQPSPYVKIAWRGKAIGAVKNVRVRAAHNGAEVFFRMEWHDESRNEASTDVNVFPDGAGILFPIGRTAPIRTMGNKVQPVNAWYWRADLGEKGVNNVAHGVGTTRVSEKSYIVCRGQWRDATWRLVFSRPLSVPDQMNEAVQLEAGASVKIGFAVWEGGHGERAGIKAFSPKWQELTLEA